MLGSLAALAGPLAIGLTSLEEFELIHYAVRVIVLGAVVALWMIVLNTSLKKQINQ